MIAASRGRRPLEEPRRYTHSMDDEEDAGRGWLHPDDRIWRHPSEHPGATGVSASEDDQVRRSARSPMSALMSGGGGALITIILLFAVGVLPGKQPVAVERVSGTPVAKALAGAGVDGESIAERIRPSIVELQVVMPQGPATGSGVIFRDDGYVLTNAHVVETASAVVVVMSDGEQDEGEIVGWDSSTDVAVVKVKGEGPFTPATLGSTETLRVGQAVFAIGSPLGLAGGPSMTGGVVSALGREVENGGNTNTLYDMVQTDAAISPGSSGGALVDSNGSVIAITTAMSVSAAGAVGLGFATPIELARDTAQQLIETGSVQHPWLGILGEDLDRATAKRMGLTGGAVVGQVEAGSPCERAGIVQGDVIVSVGNKTVTTMSQLIVALRTQRPGDTVSMKLIHDGKPRRLDVMLAARPS